MEQDLRNLLAAKATNVVAGAAYNQHRIALAERDEDPPIYYEVPLPGDAPRQALAEQAMPQLARFLHAKDMDPARPRGVVTPVFLGDRCYLLRAEDLIDAFCSLESLSREAFRARVQGWISVAD